MRTFSKSLHNVSTSDIVLKVIVYIIIISVCFVIVLPFMHIISISMSSKTAVTRMEVGLFPIGLNFDSYHFVISDSIFTLTFLNSIFYTITITFLAVLFNTMAAYAFTKKFYAKKVITYFFIIPMYFSGGLIPLYLLVTKYLKWTNTYQALILPVCFSVFYMIILRSQIETIPPSLVEAAKVDGASESRILFNIVIPAISSSIAAISMFTALSAWNMWFPVMIYTNINKFWNMQYYLRTIVFDRSFMQSTNSMKNIVANNVSPQNIQMAAVVLVALPIVMVYPFVQRYFVKGILLGSVKE